MSSDPACRPHRARRGSASSPRRSKLGGLDVLLHAVGINDRRPILDFTEDEWDHIIRVNLSSLFGLAQAAGRHMVEQGYGRVLALSSVSGLLAHHSHGPYAASKGGINQLLRVMAREWASSGVTVNALAPGYIETPLTAGELAKPGKREDLESLVPAGRLGTARRTRPDPRSSCRHVTPASSPVTCCTSTAAAPSSDAGLRPRQDTESTP